MKALTIWQPWASFLALGIKRIETRSWKQAIPPCEVVAIHAAARKEPENIFGPESKARGSVITWKGFDAGAKAFPTGAVIAVCTFERITPVNTLFGLSHVEQALGDYTPGRYAWHIGSLAELPTPIPCKGAQRLWTLPEDVAFEVVAQATKTGFYHDHSGCV